MRQLPLSLFLLGMTLIFGFATAYAQQAPGTGVNYETRLTGLEDDLRALNGRVEQLEFTVHRLDQSLQRMQADMDARLSKIETSAQTTPPMSPPSTSNTPPSPAMVETPTANGTLGSIKSQDGKITGGSINPQASPLPNTPPDFGMTTQEQYDRAFGLLRQADYDNAEKAFKEFIDKNPKDKLIDNAKYWYGETLYVRGRFNESAVAFAEAFQQNTQGTKAPDSLLKLAMSLENIEKTSDACTTLSELKSKYPNAAPTIRSRAEEERTKLKCPR